MRETWGKISLADGDLGDGRRGMAAQRSALSYSTSNTISLIGGLRATHAHTIGISIVTYTGNVFITKKAALGSRPEWVSWSITEFPGVWNQIFRF